MTTVVGVIFTFCNIIFNVFWNTPSDFGFTDDAILVRDVILSLYKYKFIIIYPPFEGFHFYLKYFINIAFLFGIVIIFNIYDLYV